MKYPISKLLRPARFRPFIYAVLSATSIATLVVSAPPVQARSHHDNDDDDRKKYEDRRNNERKERNERFEKELNRIRGEIALQQLGQAIKEKKDAKKRAKELAQQRDLDRQRDEEVLRAREQARDSYEFFPSRTDPDRHEVLYGRVDSVFTADNSFSIFSSGRHYMVTVRTQDSVRILSPDDQVRVEGYSDGTNFFAYELEVVQPQ